MDMKRTQAVNIIGKRAKYFRKLAGLTQEKAAVLLNISTRTLASYERGEHEPSTNMVQDMAHIYKTTFAKITDYKNLPLDVKPIKQIVS